ncbi:hypothetical protein LCGC14_0355250 [marine sediment metagenome]|uniref:Uncharacterized protein n=1 Tax=marine sediment metagenome TaxID=412755 RepID=A0A0F9T9R3_9ZZZZ
MPNTITSQTINDGERNLIVKVKITGDGSGDESDTILVNVSEFAGSFTEVSILRVLPTLNGFSATLSWDADTNVKAMDLLDGDPTPICYKAFGGLINDAGNGKTGDILLTTLSLNSGDEGTIVLEMKKRGGS